MKALLSKNTLIILALAISLITVCPLIYSRWAAENKNRSVALAMDYNDLYNLKQISGLSLVNLLRKIKETGINYIGLKEDTLESLEREGKLLTLSGSQLSSLPFKEFDNLLPSSYQTNLSLVTDKSYIFIFDLSIVKQIYSALLREVGKNRVKMAKQNIIEVIHGQSIIEDDQKDLILKEYNLSAIGLGLSLSKVNFLKKLGFNIIPRLQNSFYLDAKGVVSKVESLKTIGPFDMVIFAKDSVLGYKENITSTAFAFKKNNWQLGLVELTEQKGMGSLAKLLSSQIIRVHSVPQEEMEKQTPETTLNRYLRSARERGVRLLYLHPFINPEIGGKLIDFNIKYFSQIKNRLKQEHFIIGPPSYFIRSQDYQSPERIKTGAIIVSSSINFWSVIFIGFGLLAAIILWWESFSPFNFPSLIVLIGLISLMTLVAQLTGHFVFWRKILALTSAVIFPTVAIIASFPRATSDEQKIHPKLLSLGLILKSIGLTIIGLLLVVGLLSDVNFMTNADQFSGIKIAFIGPVILVSLFFFRHHLKTEPKKSIWKEISNWLRQPITNGGLALGLFFLVSLIIYLLRSGNFPQYIAPTWEINLRQWLETVFGLRPRTKEFLIGYPALLSAFYFFHQKSSPFLYSLLGIVGSIGLVSLTNTFCHIHSPLMISLLRSIYGLILGLFFGFLILGVYSFGRKFWVIRK